MSALASDRTESLKNRFRNNRQVKNDNTFNFH